MSGYLRVRNWDRFQHYKNRRPPWIKFYVELLDDYDLTALPIEAQFVYDRMLLLAAKHENAIPNDSEWIAKQLRIGTETVTNAIAMLLKGRWLSQSATPRRASNVLAARKQNAMPETETEKDPPIPRKRKSRATTNSNGNGNGQGDAPPKLRCPTCRVPIHTQRELAEHVALLHQPAAIADDEPLPF